MRRLICGEINNRGAICSKCQATLSKRTAALYDEAIAANKEYAAIGRLKFSAKDYEQKKKLDSKIKAEPERQNTLWSGIRSLTKR